MHAFLSALLFSFLLFFSAPSHADDRAIFVHTPALALKIRLDLIKEAKDEILLSTHAFSEDELGSKLLSSLHEAARRGVKVKIIVDSFEDRWKSSISYETRAALSSSNFEFYRFRPFQPKWILKGNYRLHDKLFVVDGSKMILGDRNTQNKYFGMDPHSLVSYEAYIEGKSASQASEYFHQLLETPALKRFARKKGETQETWRRQLEVLKARTKHLDFHENDFQNWRKHRSVPMAIEFIHDPVYGIHTGTSTDERILDFVGRQKKRLIIQNAYVDFTPRFRKALKEAAARGVKITVLTNTPRATDVPTVGALWERNRPFLQTVGATVWEHTGEKLDDVTVKRLKAQDLDEVAVHSKVFVGDQEAVISSYNLDFRSERFNRETGVIINSKQITNEIAEVLEREIAVLPYVNTVKDGELLHTPPGAKCWPFIKALLFRKLL